MQAQDNTPPQIDAPEIAAVDVAVETVQDTSVQPESAEVASGVLVEAVPDAPLSNDQVNELLEGKA